MLNTEDDARTYVTGLAKNDGFERLETLASELVKENELQNLISKPSESQIWCRHIADSAQLLEYVPRETISGPWMDLGTGAGFPGLVIGALLPNHEVVLVESRARRVAWLERMCDAMSLENVRVEGKRLEVVEPFDAGVISARAFAPLDKLLRSSSPFSTKHTRYVLPKGRSAAQELAAMPRQIREVFHVEHSLTDPDAGIIVSR
ncbi:16S rRNA (guanine(527)-N(7))-methyltransferase [Altererythrobacter insulae]|nr:16S rRNA (guanine(527)-N(7))-methyltransferase [Altererythrobacter insulae]